MPDDPLPAWRVRLDVPHDFAVEPGYTRAVHCHNFRPSPGELAGTWRCPVTGILMLQPSFLSENFYSASHWWGLSSWVYDAQFWGEVYRDPGIAAGVATFFSTMAPVGSTLIDTLTGIAVFAATFTSGLTADEMKWVMESDGDLARDEAIALHVRTVGDEHHRYQNWFAVQFGRIGLSFNYNGTVRAWEYDPEDLSTAPTLIDEFEIASPGELAGKEHVFALIPIPRVGLVIYHIGHSPHSKTRASSALSGVSRGHVIPYSYLSDGGEDYLHDGGKIHLGIGAWNLGRKTTFGVHRIRFKSGSQTYTDGIFDPGYKPTAAPADLSPILVPTGRGSVTAALYLADGASVWSPGLDRQGRVRLTMSSADARYTPFVYGYYLRFAPVIQSRATTPVEMEDGVVRMDFTEDDQGAAEGRMECFMHTAEQQRLVERGDTTYVVERCDDPLAVSPVWVTQFGGLARLDGEAEFVPGGYRCAWVLMGKQQRLAEVHQILDTAFDFVSVGEAVNVVLQAAGEPPVSPLPAESLEIVLPGVQDSQEFRLGTRAGDSGQDIISAMLMFMRRQWVEWYLVYDWDAMEWTLVQKPRDTSEEATWTLTEFADERDVAGRKVVIGDGHATVFRLQVDPPEANLVQPYGLSEPSAQATRVPGTPLLNAGSLADPESPDFLGRIVTASPMVAPLWEVAEINKMGRRVFDAVAHRRLKPVVQIDRYYDALKPATRCRMRTRLADGSRGVRFEELWVKRRSVRIERCATISVTLALDSVWESYPE